MSDKTALELAIEHHERYKTPRSVKSLLIILVLCLCLAGGYAYYLKKELKKIEQDTIAMQENFTKEKIELLRRIKQLQAKRETPESDIH